MLKAAAKARLDPVLLRADAAAQSLAVSDTLITDDLKTLHADVHDQVSWWTNDEVVSALEGRAEQLILTAVQLRKVLTERAAAMAAIAQLRVSLTRCGAQSGGTLNQRMVTWGDTVDRLGLEVNRPDDARTDLHLVQKIMAEVLAFAKGADHLARANQLLEDLRARGDGQLPLSAADLHARLPDFERVFAQGGHNVDWTAQLDDAMARPLHDWQNPPQAPEALDRARASYERLVRWSVVLGAACRHGNEVQILESLLVDVETTWRSLGAGGEADHVLQRVEHTLELVQGEAQRIRDDLRTRLEADVALVRDAGLGEGGFDAAAGSLTQISVRSPEHHERWMGTHTEGRTSVARTLSGVAATGDLREYLQATAAIARSRLATARAGVLADEVANQLNEIEKDLATARSDQGTVEGWLHALRTVAEASGRVERAEGAQAAAVADYRGRLTALQADVTLLATLAAHASLAATLGPIDVAACEIAPGEVRLDPAVSRVSSTERELAHGAARVDRSLRAFAERSCEELRHHHLLATRLGEPTTESPPTLPLEWRGWPPVLSALDDACSRASRACEVARARRRSEGGALIERLEATRGFVMPIEDRERVDRALAALGLACRDPDVNADELIEALEAARALVDQLTESENRLSAWHQELAKRLDALRVEGFREWNPEIAHRASALVKGIGTRPPVPWSEVEGQLQLAQTLLTRLEYEGRRRAAADVASNVAALTLGQRRTSDGAVARLLEEVAQLVDTQLPPRSLRTRLREAARRS